MKLLAIETSCDETAVTVLEAHGDEHTASFTVLGNALLSQIDIHREFGGVFPAVAKREHVKNIVAIMHASLEEAGMLKEHTEGIDATLAVELSELLVREPGLSDALGAFFARYSKPDIDAIAVTHGPGLEPALWVGVNFARALSHAWNIPIVGVNHMEGHLLSALTTPSHENSREFTISNLKLPILGLLISGGHTELVSMDSWLSYRLIGQTRDDAVGEAYDKVARMLGLPYPGGPEISKLSEEARTQELVSDHTLPRPMIRDAHCDFSFSGLKTAVLYLLKNQPELTDSRKLSVAKEFEDAVSEVLFEKTARALHETQAKTVVLGGGVSANTHIRRVFREHIEKEFPEVTLYLPEPRFTTDNAIMIGIAGFYRAYASQFIPREELKASGNLSIT